MKLHRTYVEKPWGRTDLPPMFDPAQGKTIGEVHFTNGADLPLLVKYIFTSERLSIQVHPDDDQARARGLPHGKSECWYILDAEPDATIALGLKREIPAEDLRAAALDGSIEHLLDWRPVRAGDSYFVPAGTIHAIGAGISLIEFQQNVDITYRLYDYGRPRELHVDDAIAVATRAPYSEALALHVEGDGTLVDSPQFKLARSHRDTFHEQRRWIIPLEGEARSSRETALPGEVLILGPAETLVAGDNNMLIGAQ